MSRRDVIKAGIGATAALHSSGAAMAASVAPLVLDASGVAAMGDAETISLGTARRPDGSEITIDRHSLRRNGKPWLPVMGEIHYARYPETEWQYELRKMQMGGIDIAATYVFWIHHEEIEGQFDWTGRRSLRDFVQRCGQIGLPIVVRCGPWCHGECRNGGFPDWLVQRGIKLRSNDATYLDLVHRLFTEIAGQLKGLLWKDGGPVVGIQIENEYHGPAEHLLALKKIAQEVGLDVPLYTRTGWPNLTTPMPPDELLPLFGSYADGFWDRGITPMPGTYGDTFRFILARGEAAAAIGTDQLGVHSGKDEHESFGYPYFCCEIGGGMERSYHRRIHIAPADIEASALVKIGSGNNLQGYYMYHGGTNPEGRLSTLQESQATNYVNDLPVRSYDFQAPLGEFGQIREHYHRLRRLHLFLRDYGSLLATRPAILPVASPANSHDSSTLRWSARTEATGDGGFLFVNNYQRLQPMPAKTDVQFEVRLSGGYLRLPMEPFTVPADSGFFWPFRWDLSGARLIYATAQPICQITDNGTAYCVFAQTTGVPAEFVFDSNGLTVEQAAGAVTHDGDRVLIRKAYPGTDAAIRLRTADGRRIGIMLLDEAQSLSLWKGTLQGRERLFLTPAGLILEEGAVRLNSADPAERTVAIFPAPAHLSAGGARVVERQDGLFRSYTPELPKMQAVPLTWESVQAAGPARTVLLGSHKVAEAPSDADFSQAAVWRLKLPQSIDAQRDLILRIRYTGDVARLTLGGKLLTDNFYNGNPFEIGLRRYAPDIYHQELLLQVLPLRKDAPIYLPTEAHPDFGTAESVVHLAGIDVIERQEVRLAAG